MNYRKIIPSVNYHLWEPCNMRCKFCFAPFQDVKKTILPKGHLPEEQAIQVIEKLAAFGFKKINFAGGEPMLCPWIGALIKKAYTLGMTTAIITNGSRLSDQFLEDHIGILDWIGVSIDSLNGETNRTSGRAVTGKHVISETKYINLLRKVTDYGYRLKVNTVIHSKNYKEDFNTFIRKTKPERWKVLQVLPMKGQNDKHIADFEVTATQFESFRARHASLSCLVPETTGAITSSYVMVDPAGRFFDNNDGKHTYSDSLLDKDTSACYNQMRYDYKLFYNRGGIYS